MACDGEIIKREYTNRWCPLLKDIYFSAGSIIPVADVNLINVLLEYHNLIHLLPKQSIGGHKVHITILATI